MFWGTRWYALAAVLGLIVGASPPAKAAIVLIDFNSLGQDEAITTQFAALGVTFSGLFGDTLDTPTVAAANLTSTDPEIHTMIATFSAPITQAGFDIVLNAFTDTINIDVFRFGTFIGGGGFTIPVFSIPPPATVHIDDAAGFDRIEIFASSQTLNLSESGVVIDNFFFEAPVVVAVPEPASIGMSLTGMLLCWSWRRRRAA